MLRFKLLCFILTPALLFAQSKTTIADLSPDRMRMTTYGGDSLDRALFILPSKDAVFPVIGLTYESGVGNTQILQVNRELKIEKVIVHDNPAFSFCFAGAQAHDGNYLLTGFTSIEENGLDSYFTMIGPDGNLQWTMNFGGEKNDRTYKCARTKDNGFVIAGQTESSGDYAITGQIYKISAQGDLQWERLLGVTELNRLYSVIELGNGDLIISGITNANYPDNSDILIYRLDSGGKVIWQKRHGGSLGDIAHSLVKGPDDTFFIVGYTAEKSTPLSDPQILHFDSNGTLLKQHLITTGMDVRLINGYLEDKGNYIGTGFVRKDLESDWDILFSKLHLASGTFDLYKTHISDQDEEAYHAVAFGKDKALIAGHTMGNGNEDIVLIEWKYE